MDIHGFWVRIIVDTSGYFKSSTKWMAQHKTLRYCTHFVGPLLSHFLTELH